MLFVDRSQKSSKRGGDGIVGGVILLLIITALNYTRTLTRGGAILRCSSTRTHIKSNTTRVRVGPAITRIQVISAGKVSLTSDMTRQTIAAGRLSPSRVTNLNNSLTGVHT